MQIFLLPMQLNEYDDVLKLSATAHTKVAKKQTGINRKHYSK